MKKQVPYIDPFRSNYWELTDDEKRTMEQVKAKAKAMYSLFEEEIPIGPSRNKAVEALHESVFWAVHGLTGAVEEIEDRESKLTKILRRKR